MRPSSKSFVGFDATTSASRLPGLDRRRDPVAHGGKHHELLLDFLEPDHRSQMARDDPGVRVGDFHHLPAGRHHAVDGSAVVDADVGIAQRRRHVADVHDVGVS